MVARGSFTEDWVSPRFSSWAAIFRDLEGRPTQTLEIGSFEGLSACFFLWRLPLTRLTCVDPFKGITEGVPEQAGAGTRDLEAIFELQSSLWVDGVTCSGSSRATRSVACSTSRPRAHSSTSSMWTGHIWGWTCS